MTTLSDLRLRCRRLIGDVQGNVFSDEQLNDWIYTASMDLSLHFPRQKTVELIPSPSIHAYDLSDDFLGVLSVEYPAGETPPRYLTQKPYTQEEFWLSDEYYDVHRHADKSNPSELLISASPPEGSSSQRIRVVYQAYHQELKADTAQCSLPEHLHHLIPLFVRWRAWMALSTLEGMDPDPTKLLAATHEVNAGRAERAYYEALRQAKKAEGASARLSWRMDAHDRIY